MRSYLRSSLILCLIPITTHAETINLDDAWKACQEMASSSLVFDEPEMEDWNYKHVWYDDRIAKDCETIQEMVKNREIADRDARAKKWAQEYRAEQDKKVSTYKPLIEQFLQSHEK